MSGNDKEVAVEKVAAATENDKADPKAEVKGTKRAAETGENDVKKAKREANGEEDEVEVRELLRFCIHTFFVSLRRVERFGNIAVFRRFGRIFSLVMSFLFGFSGRGRR